MSQKTNKLVWEDAYTCFANELNDIQNNKLALFALHLKYKFEDIRAVALDAITDGNDDKKLDVVHLDAEAGYAVIVQCYEATNRQPNKTAKANKAMDLNTGLSWLLHGDLDVVPQKLSTVGNSLRKAIQDNQIKQLHIWYVHNLKESNEINQELDQVRKTTLALLQTSFTIASNIEIFTKQIGNETLSDWYENCKTPILYNKQVKFVCPKGYELRTDQWKSISTAIKIIDLVKLYKENETKLFSANVRDYLGYRRSDSNINYAIRETCKNEPNNFWAYNNGLTIITHNFHRENRHLVVDGLSIVNGAQTTGAVGSLDEECDPNAKVQVRFIAVNPESSELIENIIKFNNSQNKVQAADFRSTDSIQKRLREEFENIPDAEYLGGRRGSANDAITRKPNLLGSYHVGQALTAFHDDPIVAYNKKSWIWEHNKAYEKIFNDKTSAKHIVFCSSLVKSIETYKAFLLQKSDLTEQEQELLDFLKKRGAIYLVTYAIARSLETILGQKITDSFSLSFRGNCSPSKAEKYWTPIITTLLNLCKPILSPILDQGFKNFSEVKESTKTFVGLVATTTNYLKPTFDEFKNKVLTQ